MRNLSDRLPSSRFVTPSSRSHASGLQAVSAMPRVGSQGPSVLWCLNLTCLDVKRRTVAFLVTVAFITRVPRIPVMSPGALASLMPPNAPCGPWSPSANSQCPWLLPPGSHFRGGQRGAETQKTSSHLLNKHLLTHSLTHSQRLMNIYSLSLEVRKNKTPGRGRGSDRSDHPKC